MDRAHSPWGVVSLAILGLSLGVLAVFVGVRVTTPAEQAYVSIDQWDWSVGGTAVRSVATETVPRDRHLRDVVAQDVEAEHG
jgi:hypothetical protein